MILAHPYTSIGRLSHPVIPEPSHSLNLVKLSSLKQAERLCTRAVRWGEGATAVTAPWLSLATYRVLSHPQALVPWRQALCWGEAPCNGEGDGSITCPHPAGRTSAGKHCSMAHWAQIRPASAVTALSLPSREAGQCGMERLASKAGRAGLWLWGLGLGLQHL